MLLIQCLLATAGAAEGATINPKVEDDAPALPALAAVDLADAASLTIDAKVPVEILVSGFKLAQLYVPGKSTYRIVPGTYQVRLYTGGKPTDFDVTMAAHDELVFLVGRTGTTLDRPVTSVAAEAAGPGQVELRYVGGGGALVRIDGLPHSVRAGMPISLALNVGTHPLSVRNADGTVIWANGTLEVGSGRIVVVQIGEGRMPEVSGPGRFHAGGG